MRVAIVAIGSRGDVQPLIALGLGLAARGATVSLATTTDFEASVRQAGLASRPVRGHAGQFFSGAAGMALRDRLSDARAFRRLFYLQRFYRELLDDVTAACRDADVIVCWPWTRFATSLAEKFGVPVFIACQYPPMHLPTTAFANPYQQADRVDEAVRRSWRLALPALQMGQETLDQWRSTSLGLPPVGWRQDLRRLRRLPQLLGFSTLVVERPADWAPWIHITGYWVLEDSAAYRPPPDLVRFLDAGPPPVCIGFSSQVSRDAAATTRKVIDAVTLAGRRAILVTAFGGLKGVDLPDTVFPVSSVSYDWLLPQVSAVVHQGGAGSAAAAMRAGVPSVAVPFGYDQHFWAARLDALGVGPAPLSLASLSAESLAAALMRMTTDETMRARARTLGAALRAEDGISRAAELILGPAAPPR
jgi:UDP:flavonoid glycosyltransferase YjiC (YdhE family)